MKSPDDIKKGLECCAKNSTLACLDCPYRREKREKKPCFDMLLADAAELNAKLEQRLAQAERERDAAVHDLKLADELDCEYCKHQFGGCTYDGCKQCSSPCPCGSCRDNSNYVWRGVCPENSKEENA